MDEILDNEWTGDEGVMLLWLIRVIGNRVMAVEKWLRHGGGGDKRCLDLWET